MKFRQICGVDFSGARLAGQNTWIATLQPNRRKGTGPRLDLVDLQALEDLCGTAERSTALSHLVKLVSASSRTLWAMDFPFGIPVELMPLGARWHDQFDLIEEYAEDGYGLGLECIRRARRRGKPMHVRRLTDHDERAPFDPYHYRIIYQTFHGMRDVLAPLRRRRRTAILPFQYRRLPSAERVLVEACPSSTLKRLGLPHQNYKQPAGGPLLPYRRRTRRRIVSGLRQHVAITPAQQRVIMRNGGGDALDAVIAAVGAEWAWRTCDHGAVARHPCYPREGRLYV